MPFSPYFSNQSFFLSYQNNFNLIQHFPPATPTPRSPTPPPPPPAWRPLAPYQSHAALSPPIMPSAGHARMHVRAYAHGRTHAHARTHGCTQIRTHVRTHTHTHAQSRRSKRNNDNHHLSFFLLSLSSLSSSEHNQFKGNNKQIITQ